MERSSNNNGSRSCFPTERGVQMNVIATDLDRTLIPNGSHRQTKNAMSLFKKLIKKNKTTLIFVTGRNERLLRDGIARYSLPTPKFAVALVGTLVYKFENGKLKEDASWKAVLAKEWRNLTRKDIARVLSGIKGIKQQELSKLNDFKQSYYVPLSIKPSSLLSKVRAKLRAKKIKATLIYSVDVNRKIGLLDVMPPSGNKQAALEHVLKKIFKTQRKEKNKVMFAGDSGNDIHALTSGYFGVLVKNASPSVKEKLLEIAKKKKLKGRVYIAKGNFVEPHSGKLLNGNYVSGIIEGAYRFGIFK
ncbi:HAD-IIB family hydrolase [Candidatus Pacearchaeota archaeon]|nr:MAG: HAD-IIB family hydrolase [Candidatus Pacearchaeota archaeon]